METGKTGKVTISNAKKYTEITKEQNPSMHVDHSSKDNIEALESLFDECWKGTLGVPNTHKIHQVVSFHVSGHPKYQFPKVQDS